MMDKREGRALLREVQARVVNVDDEHADDAMNALVDFLQMRGYKGTGMLSKREAPPAPDRRERSGRTRGIGEGTGAE